MEPIYITKTNDCGTFKCVYNISQENDGGERIPIPKNWLDAVIDPRVIALVPHGTMLPSQIAAEINTMEKYRLISPKLYGSIWYMGGISIYHCMDYETPTIANSKNPFNKENQSNTAVIFFMERCHDMNECIKNPDTYVTKLVTLFKELVHTHKIFSTDMKIKNVCCSEQGDFRLLDVDPRFIFNVSQDSTINENCAYIMMLIFSAELAFNPDENKRIIGHQLIKLAFPETYDLLNTIIGYAGMHRQQVNPGTFDAFYMICHYTFGDESQVNYMCKQYDSVPDKSLVIKQVKDHLIRRFAVFFAAEGGVRKRRIKKQRRSNIRRSNIRRSNKKYKFNRTKRKLL